MKFTSQEEPPQAHNGTSFFVYLLLGPEIMYVYACVYFLQLEEFPSKKVKLHFSQDLWGNDEFSTGEIFFFLTPDG